MILNANALHIPLAAQSVHCAVTSPPYMGLQDYGLAPTAWPEVAYSPLPGLPESVVPAEVSNLGQEASIEAFIGHLVLICREVWRVLRDDGTFWLNIGDSYFGSSQTGGTNSKEGIAKRKGGMFKSSSSVRNAISCDNSDKELEGSQGYDCLCGNLCDVCRAVYRRKSHIYNSLAPTLIASLFAPNQASREFEIGHFATSDLFHQASHILDAIQDRGPSFFRDDVQLHAFQKSTHHEFFERLLAECWRRGNSSSCLSCGCSLTDDVQEFSRTNHGQSLPSDNNLHNISGVSLQTHRTQGSGRACEYCNASDLSSYPPGDIQPCCTINNHIREVSALKAKDMMLVPQRLALALQADGWYVRSMPWIKANGRPESVTDRPSKSEEYILMLTKSDRYYYDLDAVRQPATNQTGAAARFDRKNGKAQNHVIPNQAAAIHRPDRRDSEPNLGGRQLRTSDFAWESLDAYISHLQFIRKHRGLLLGQDGLPAALFSTVGNFPGAHFATFPKSLVEPLILASTSAKGVCSRCGAPWRRIVEKETFQAARDEPTGKAAGRPEGDATRRIWERTRALRATGRDHDNPFDPGQTVGWEPGCTCNDQGESLAEDDLELISSPLSVGKERDDPTTQTGRAGYNRARGEGEGVRTMTRYEQRRYARQLRRSPHRPAMEAEVGPAFTHYIRTDRSGGRPVPAHLLASWLRRGWLEQVSPPAFCSPPVAPALVLDLFAGSGTTGQVCRESGRRFVGLDLNASYLHEFTRQRAQEQPVQTNLFARI